MSLSSNLQSLLVAASLTASALATTTQEVVLEDAKLGRVIATNDLLALLMPEQPGTTTRLIDEIQDSLEASRNPHVAKLLDHARALPDQVLAERASMLEDSLNTELWSNGTGVSLEVCAKLGDKTSLRLLPQLMLLKGAPSAAAQSRHEKGLEITIKAILMRHSEAYSGISSLYRDLPDWCAPALLRALANTRELAALHALPELLGKRGDLDAYVLTQIASIARYARAPLSDSEHKRIRSYLHALDPEQRQRAAQALGFLDDADSTAQLIELLRDPVPSVSQASYAALRLITAMTIDPGYRRWLAWHEREAQWWAEDSEPHLTYMRNPDTKGLVVALRELGSRRLFRREIAPWITPLLESSNKDTVRVAISALTSLRANDEQTIASIEALLSHPNTVIRNQASDSLRVITRRVFLPRAPRPQ